MQTNRTAWILPTGGVHPQLLDEADQCLDAFLQDMADSGNLDRVMVLSFSEFGRRPQENGSNGSDHGTANCLFAMGGGVNGGVFGGQPDLAPLNSALALLMTMIISFGWQCGTRRAARD